MMKTKAQSHKMIVTVLVILISCFFVNTVNCNPQGNNTRKQQERAILANSVDDERGFIFLKKKLHDQNDVIIYSVNQQGLADYGVSESMGQAMEYAALRKDRQYFDLLAAQTDKYYLDRAGYYYWKINAENYAGEQISALVDDLRIFKAYYLAAQNNMGDYSKQLAYVSESIYKFDSDGKYLYDFYDDRSQQKADYVSLFYLDMNSIDMLKAYDKQKWQELWQNSRELLQKIEKREYGFYPVAFSYSEKKYVWNETGINMVENLYTALNLYNADGDTGSLLKFMREEIKTNKKIANWYNFDGSVKDENESAAVYALAARLFWLNNDSKYALWCYSKVLAFQIEDVSDFGGGFGDQDSGMVYAFDQLEALLMLRMVQGIGE